MIDLIRKSRTAYLKWNRVPLLSRIDAMNKFSQQIGQSEIINFFCDRALELLQPVHLEGVTGEENIHYVVGRGIVLVRERSDDERLLIAALVAAILSGNSVIYSGRNTSRISEFKRALAPTDVLSFVDENIYNQDIDALIYLGDDPTDLRVQIAKRHGAIIPFIWDRGDFSTFGEESVLLRLVNEKTKTINLTAVGGNIELLRRVSD